MMVVALLDQPIPPSTIPHSFTHSLAHNITLLCISSLFNMLKFIASLLAVSTVSAFGECVALCVWLCV
jgi:formate hydrogenlyase subunit 4